jgi:hypothetical protein
MHTHIIKKWGYTDGRRLEKWENADSVEKMVKTWLWFQLTTRTWVESWFAKSAGKSFGMKIVWYVALPVRVALVQAADEEEFRIGPSQHLARIAWRK